MIKVGDIVTLRSPGSRTDGTGIVLEVYPPWASVSWSWVDGRVGRNLMMDLKRVPENRAKDTQDRV